MGNVNYISAENVGTEKNNVAFEKDIKPATILVTGGSGLVGTAISKVFAI